MARHDVLLLALILLCLHQAVVAGELRCYDCMPDDDGQCHIDDRRNGTRSQVCELTHLGTALKSLHMGNLKSAQATPANATVQFACFSMYFIGDPDKNTFATGIYRGCYQKDAAVGDVCDLLKEELPAGNMTYCRFCDSDNCNNHKIDETDAANSLPISLFLLVINSMICFYVIQGQ